MLIILRLRNQRIVPLSLDSSIGRRFVVEGAKRLGCEGTLRDGKMLYDTNGVTMARYK